ncbi:SIR2 family NAD-dependent protein deacylase [Flavobacterium oreochromis]|uniref:protein acetyllysine N-acetyltransferase n=1 Tax=Flavobacterium columnare TaxID=996 RepID=A0A246GCP9_9FLAO|nr:Sir2 family NAD-dependent protein deacetylase [Flavobacterium oreochromis]OWP78906.1 iron dicitrate transport regulator FecR [Flavobacterium oreochromis]
MKPTLEELIKDNLYNPKRKLFTFLTGAGVSAASGLPTYRSLDGIWIKGTKYHKPEEFGTFKYFSKNQEEVWQYNLFWKKLIDNALPNPSHYLLAELEEILQEKFQLITQNIDGLHQKGGSKNVFEIHGNKRNVRCATECSGVLPMPENLKAKELTEDLLPYEIELLHCTKCGSWLRPNTLWFDEYYNEKNYFSDSALRAAKNTSILFIIGTSGATFLPQAIAEQVLGKGGYIVEINTEEDSYFFKRFSKTKKYLFLNKNASDALAEVKSIVADCYDLKK